LELPDIKEATQVFSPNFDSGTNIQEFPVAGNTRVRLSGNRNQSLPSALIYHDSFMNGVLPFLEPHFRHMTSIPLTSTPGIWNIDWVDSVHPDIVIIESVERYINVGFYIPGN
jgi:hypothetical protein